MTKRDLEGREASRPFDGIDLLTSTNGAATHSEATSDDRGIVSETISGAGDDAFGP